MFHFIRGMLTEGDNETADPVKTLGATGFLVFCGLVGYSIFKGQAFDATTTAGGMAMILGAIGGGVGLKVKGEHRE